MATLETVQTAYAYFATSRPGADLSTVDIRVCAMILQPIPDDALIEAAVKLAREPGDFLPGAGTLFQAALDILDTELSADEAWLLVLKHANHATMREQNPVKLPARTAKALEFIGGDLGWTLDELPFRRKEFVAAYRALGKRWRNDVALGRLPALTAPEQKRLTE